MSDYDYSLDRPYDRAFRRQILEAIKKNRSHANGRELLVTSRRIKDGCGTRLVNVYPWEGMEVGDFFFIDMGNRKVEDWRSFFKQTERRLDVELTIRKYERDGVKGLLVWKSFEGPVSSYKKAAGLPIPKGQGPDRKPRSRASAS